MTSDEPRLLMLVDEEPAQQRLVAALVARAGWRTIAVADSEAALAMLGTHDGMALGAVLIDQAMPGDDAVELIAALHERRPALPLLLLTALDSVAIAIAALRAGARDYLIKPVAPERLIAALEVGVAAESARGELRPLSQKLVAPLGFDEIVGSDPQFRAALAIAAKSARSRVPVLIEGEAGAGKQVVAAAIHATSPRERRPQLSVDCAAIPANMIESELFGHEPGAFAGAFTRAIGKCAQADGGTLFLDAIDRLGPEVQLKLLTLLEQGCVTPVGGRPLRELDVRIIAGVRRPLIEAVANGDFREDLYYKLATVHVVLPPLRERASDIAPLARHLLARISHQPGMVELGITDDALALLAAWHWPGNVRQLHNALFRAAAHSQGGVLTAADFPQLQTEIGVRGVAAKAHGAGVAIYSPDGHLRPLEAIEADVIRLAIGHYRGRMTEVARRLGIGRSTLYRKLAELGISDVA